MNKLIIPALLSCWFFSLTATLQAQELYYPTDIIYHQPSDRFFVSNWADGNGNIIVVDDQGNPVSTFFSGLTYPGGMAIIGNTLYVVNNKDLYGGYLPSYVVGIDLTTGAQTSSFPVDSDGIYLDLMTAGNNGNLYFGDSEKERIFKYNPSGSQLTELVTGVENPFGICYDYIHDRVVFTHSTFTMSWLKSVSPDGSNLTTLMSYQGYLEGIIMDEKGDFYYSSWGNDYQWDNEPVYKNNGEFTNPNTLASDHNRPFGMCFGKNNELIVCNWGNHTLRFIDLTPYNVPELPNTLSGNISLFPNPCHGTFTLSISGIQKDTFSTIQIVDMHGSVVREWIAGITDSKIEADASGLTPGIYLVRLPGIPGHPSVRMMVD
ncbi:MAG: T9SS type A sorting domain-containing protein [Bacteroidales bacterium]|nr:T9SS type A sorting domain-containing protein [Bacteroidales bacterium]